MYFNPNLLQNQEKGYILLEDNIKCLRKFLHIEGEHKSRKIDLSDFLNIESFAYENGITNNEMSSVDEEGSIHNEEDFKFKFIDDYFK